MSTIEVASMFVDTVQAEMIECAPIPEPVVVKTQIPEAPDETPVERASEATIEQTGAGPPPRVTHG